MKQTRKGKRFYKVGEKVYIKDKKIVGEIVELDIQPDKNIYQALIQYEVGTGTGTPNASVELVKNVYNLWEIDKNKVDMYKAKRKAEKQPIIYFAKLRESAIIPSKVDENVGYDIYANFQEGWILINPSEVKMIPTGIASCVSDDWGLIVKERGSTGLKGMAVRAGVVDSGYRGEIFIAINNTGDYPIIIAKESVDKILLAGATVYPYEKAIAQLVLVNVPKAKVEELYYEELQAIPSQRGDGKLGESGK